MIINTTEKKKIINQNTFEHKGFDYTISVGYNFRTKKSWTLYATFVSGSNAGEAILRLFYMYCRIEQMSEHIDV